MNYEEVIREGSRIKAFGLGVASIFDFMGNFGPQPDIKPNRYKVKYKVPSQSSWQRAGDDVARSWEQVGSYMYTAMDQVKLEHPELAKVGQVSELIRN